MILDAHFAVARGALRLDVALTAREGETLALVGPNGAGKSTAVEVLAGLLRPDAGRVTLDGVVLDDAATGLHVPPHRRPVGVVFQDRLLFPHLSALDNAAFPLRARGVGRREARRRAAALLEALGVGHRARARPPALSGGEAQRVALARALATGPRLLLLDEPLSAVDVGARAALRGVLRRILHESEGVHVVVTHDPVEAAILADRLVVLEDGRVSQEGTPQDIRSAPRSRYAADLVGVNLYRGRLERSGGAGRLVLGGGEIVVAWPEAAEAAGEAWVAVVRPAAVALHDAPPEHSSARNVIAGRVAEIAVEGARARVRLDAPLPVVAEVTAQSVGRLGLAEGAPAWASFKAVEVELLRAGEEVAPPETPRR